MGSIKNFEIKHRKKPSTTSKLRISKLPAEDKERMALEPESNEKDPKLKTADLKSGTKKTYKKKKGKWNTSVVKNGMKIELKDFVSEESSKTNPPTTKTSNDPLIDGISSNHVAEKNDKE